ncbi:MAG: GPH family glycoside/pentoside/hexuronide:cation symporter [Glaciecola sp.]|jgi:GPH family glycoside/pentoside/hexuronide:cation symporter
MLNQKTGSREKVPIGQKMAFGAGHLVLNLLPGSLAIFMFFLLTAFGMDPFLAGLLGGLPRIFDALTDPIMGFVSDNTDSRWGRRRPYIFVGAILSGILFVILWQLDPENTQNYNFWYFLILSMVFLIGNTMFATPLIGLGYEMTSNYNERTRLMASSQIMGQIAWMIVPWFWVIIASPDMLPIGAEEINRIAELGLSDEETQKATLQALQANGVRKLSIIVGAICIVLGVLPALFCKGIDAANMENRKKITLKKILSNVKDLIKGIVQVSKSKPFVKLCGATFLVFNGFQLVASFSFFIIVFYMFSGDYEAAGNWPAWFSTVTAIVTAFLVIPIISRIANKWGKREAFIISTATSIIGYILKWWAFDPDNPLLLFLPVPFMAFGLGGLFTLMMSMTADVCDLDELKNGMPRKEGTFGAIYWWMVKLGQALALVLGGLVLKLVGFDQNEIVQNAETMTQLRIADIVIPVVTASLAIWVMWKYSLDETRAREIKEELVERRGEL